MADTTFSHAWCLSQLESYNSKSTVFDAKGDVMTIGALVFSVVLMMLLGFTLLCTGLLRLFLGRHTPNLSIGRYNLYPVVRVLLRVTFVLFLPLLSTTLSLTKEQQDGGGTTTRLLLVLLWMLLIELIRKKVQVMVLPTDGSSFSRGTGRFTLMDNSDELAHVMWTGYLVYSNIHKVGHPLMKAIFTVLWSLSLLKLVQRTANTYVASRSFATARNPLLIDVYMQHAFGHGRGDEDASAPAAADASEHMKTCKFVVAGETKLLLSKDKKKKKKHKSQATLVTTPSYDSTLGGHPGHLGNEKHAGLDIELANIAHDEFVTVGKVWAWGQEDHYNYNAKLFSLKTPRGRELENMCLAFSLFKMLRRRFEKYPMVEVGSPMVRRLMLRGLLNLARPFEVLQLEVGFLDNYYQAAQNVVMSQPILFVSNFALSMLFVPIYIVAIVAILLVDKGAIFLYCTARGTITVDIEPMLALFLSITLALLGTLICVETSEFYTSYFFSNWNTVRLACTYGSLSPRRSWCRPIRWVLYYLIAFRFLVSAVLRSLAKLLFRHQGDSDTRIKINQVSIVNACGPFDKLISAWTYQVTLATKAKGDIIKALQDTDERTGTVSLPTAHGMFANVLDGSVTDIILAAHLATELFHIEQKQQEEELQVQGGEGAARVVATTLSRYCMYLVVLSPALLPDDDTWVSQKLDDMRDCLAKVLQQCGGCTMCTPSRPCKHRMAESLRKNEAADLDDPTATTLQGALKLRDSISSWDDLATFWVKLLIYLAPSNDIQGHAKAIASTGGDLITYLWTFCTHAGITREPTTAAV
ncbi:hypothetical protein BS78_05G104900 [Paspalum vaginatum]|nr:hypothetical protein BS78_05G104900 [Paspalum vaginatum]